MYQKIKDIWNIKKWRWTIIIATIVVLGLIFLILGRKNDPLQSYTLGSVERGDIIEEVSVTGKVTPVKEVSLSLPVSGRIAFIGTKVGDRVSAGALLASISNADIQAELKQAEIDLEKEILEYDQLVRASKISRDGSQDNASSNEIELINARETLLQTLKEGYAKIDNAESTYIDQFFEKPRSFPIFGIRLSEGVTTYLINGTLEEKNAINKEKKDVNILFEAWKKELNTSLDNFDAVTKNAKDVIQKIDVLLQNISSVLDSRIPSTTTEENLYGGYRSDISAARVILRTVSADINSASQALASQESLVSPDELKVKEFAKKSAEAQVQAVRSKLDGTLVRAPFSGTVTYVDAELGQIVSPTTPLIRLISLGQFEIEAYVAESDISKIKIGDKAKITLDAYGQEQIFEAKVSLIDIAETMLEGVATYKVTFIFEKDDERIKSGMTANIDVRTAEKTDVLRIPQRALIFRDTEKYVKVIRDEKLVEEVSVITGLRGGDGHIEIISGLNEGDTIVVFDKSAK